MVSSSPDGRPRPISPPGDEQAGRGASGGSLPRHYPSTSPVMPQMFHCETFSPPIGTFLPTSAPLVTRVAIYIAIRYSVSYSLGHGNDIP